MKKIISSLVLILITISTLFSKNIVYFNKDTLLINVKKIENLECYIINDKTEFKISEKKVKKNTKVYLYKDSIITDSLEYINYYKIFYSHLYNSIFFTENISDRHKKRERLTQWNLNNGQYDLIDTVDYGIFDLADSIFVVGASKHPEYQRVVQYLQSYHPHTNKYLDLVDVSDKVKEEYSSLISAKVSPLKNKIFFETGRTQGGGYYNCQQFIYNLSNNTLKEYKNTLTKDCMIGYSNPFDYDINKQYFFKSDYCLDENFKFNCNILESDKYIKGFIIEDRKIKAFYYESRLDNDEKVLIPVKTTMPLEKNLYNIYNNILIPKENFKKFGYYELKILKNMVFAKHNYKFNGEYYQAFFNRYRFYHKYDASHNLIPHTKNVNNLLTETDKQNLKIIIEEMRIRN